MVDAVHFAAIMINNCCREGGHHTNRDTHAHREGQSHMYASPHSSPAVEGMICEQVVAATRGLEEISLLGTVVFLVHIKEGVCNFQCMLSPDETYPLLLRPRAALAIVGTPPRQERSIYENTWKRSFFVPTSRQDPAKRAQFRVALLGGGA